jgi:hypothetical protein
MNDILNRAGEAPDIPLVLQKSVAQIDLYSRVEGELKAIRGLEQTKCLPSFFRMQQNLNIGQSALFAKNGGDPILSIMLGNTDKKQLEKDMAAMEAAIVFDVE